MIKTIFTLILLTTLVISCNQQNNDITRPKIETFKLLGANPQVGGRFSLSSLITDDKGIITYKVLLYDDFGYNADTIEDTERLSLTNIISFDAPVGTHLVNQNINIPLNASAGPYKISLEVSDEAGNEAVLRKTSFEVLNPADQPQVTLTSPTEDTVISGVDTLTVQGLITDNAYIKKITFELSNTSGYSEIISSDSINSASWDIASDGMIKLPFNSNTGEFRLYVNVQDTSGNLKRIIRKFTKN